MSTKLQLNIQDDRILVLSFDVFDTAITHVVGSSNTFYLILGKHFVNQSLISNSPEAFARARLSAEDRALKNRFEVTLSQIYAELGKSLFLTHDQCNSLMESEQSLKAEMLRAIPAVKKSIQIARSQGKRIVFISDMHLSSNFIKAQLTRQGIWQEGDHCYISCELGASKRSGKLFQEVLNLEGISSHQLCHYGNDFYSDFTYPKKLNVNAEHFVSGNLNRYEELLDAESWATEGLSSIMAGASRLARLSTPALSEQEQVIRDVTAGVASPVLVGYVLFILLRAKQLGLKRLYFLSRDGQILLRIAQKLSNKLNLPIELRYIYGSRLSWSRPTLNKVDEIWIWDPIKRNCSIESLCNRLGINPERIKIQLAKAGFADKDWARILSIEEIQKLREVIYLEDVKKLIFQESRQQFKILSRYFEQEGLLDSTPKGIVDLGWSGSLYKALIRVLKGVDKNLKPPIGFYYGLTSDALLNTENSLEVYSYDARFGTGNFDFSINPWLEIFCSADHGTVLKLEDVNGKIQPFLEKKDNQLVIDWGLPLVWRTIDSFLDNLWINTDLLNLQADLRQVSLNLVKTLNSSPSRTEAKVLGSYPWEEHLSDQGSLVHPWASPYTWIQVINSALKREFPRHSSCSWIEGSVLISPPLLSRLLRIYSITKFKVLSAKSRLISKYFSL